MAAPLAEQMGAGTRVDLFGWSHLLQADGALELFLQFGRDLTAAASFIVSCRCLDSSFQLLPQGGDGAGALQDLAVCQVTRLTSYLEQ